MVSVFTKTAIVSFLSSVMLFRCLYIPVPDGMPPDDQWLMRKLYFALRAGDLLSRLGHIMGYDNHINIKRYLRQLFDFPPSAVPGVQSGLQIFDGVVVTVYNKSSWSSSGRGLLNTAELRPAIYYIHGGAWAYGYVDGHAALERRLVNDLDVVLVSVHYRLAPEHPYPEPFQDCLTALTYFHEHSTEFGVDPNRITIAGDSAGGNLAAAVTLKLRDDGRRFLHRQILISPATQISTFRSRAFTEHGEHAIPVDPMYYLMYMNENVDYLSVLASSGHISDRVLQHKAWPYIDKYHSTPLANGMRNEAVAHALEAKMLDPYLCPMMADSLAGLPPALVLMSEFDVLRDDALAYADRLQAEGTETVVVKTNGFHGAYSFFTDSSTGEIMVRSIVDYMKRVYSEVR